MCLSVAVHRTVNIRLLSLPIYDFSKVLVVWLWMIYFDFNLPFKKNLLPLIFQLRGAQEIWLHVSITIEYNYCTSAHGLAIKSAKYWFKCLTLMGRPINCGSVPWLLLIIQFTPRRKLQTRCLHLSKNRPFLPRSVICNRLQ